jgi:hypothetical protein
MPLPFPNGLSRARRAIQLVSSIRRGLREEDLQFAREEAAELASILTEIAEQDCIDPVTVIDAYQLLSDVEVAGLSPDDETRPKRIERSREFLERARNVHRTRNRLL